MANRPSATGRKGSSALSCLFLSGTVLLLALLISLVVTLLAGRQPEVKVHYPAEGCQVSVDNIGASLTWEQSTNVSIIVGESIRRGLPPRAATIALVTAYQESDIRNLDYGDRDSIGLFQQRPSQGWGTVDQIMDPWYAAGKFYDHLVKVPGWESGVINDVAQTVQRSGFPDAYGKHEAKGRAWASALTGYSPAAVRCNDHTEPASDLGSLTDYLQRVWPGQLQITPIEKGLAINFINPGTPERYWSIAQLIMLRARIDGVHAIQLGQQLWANDPLTYAGWQPAAQPTAQPTPSTEAELIVFGR